MSITIQVTVLLYHISRFFGIFAVVFAEVGFWLEFSLGFTFEFFKMGVGGKAIFAGQGVFEKNLFERLQGEGHIGAEEDKGDKGGQIGNGEALRWEVQNSVEGKLTQDDGKVKNGDVDNEDGVLGEVVIGVKDEGNGKGDDEKGSDFCEEVIVVDAEEGTV